MKISKYFFQKLTCLQDVQIKNKIFIYIYIILKVSGEIEHLFFFSDKFSIMPNLYYTKSAGQIVWKSRKPEEDYKVRRGIFPR